MRGVVDRLFADGETLFPRDRRAGRLSLLDAMRGAAAFAVLFWHYQHFFWPIGGGVPQAEVRAFQPFHDALAVFYDHGSVAVPVFWMLSGFVFATVYFNSGASTRAFAINRFARLYPLHLLTLILVALLQLMMIARFGEPAIYNGNTAPHFILQLALASNWLSRFGYSFNGPIWSVSVEVLVYLVFWLMHRVLPRLGVMLPTAVAIGFLALSTAQPEELVFLCGYYFFVGVSLCSTAAALSPWRWWLAAATVAVILLGGLRELDSGFIVMVFGGLILLAALAEQEVPRGAARLFGAIGDTSYGMYLWHVPLQLLFFLVVPSGAGPALARQSWFLVAYLGAVVVVARLSFILFERPMRERLRRLKDLGRAGRSSDGEAVGAGPF